MVHLPSTVSADEALPALYAFTDCEVSLAPNACVIKDNHPQFLSVNDLIKSSADPDQRITSSGTGNPLGGIAGKMAFCIAGENLH